jgi:hypothetical protein
MPIIKPFMASRKYFATIGDGAGVGPDFAIPATAFLDDAGVAATAFPASLAYYVIYLNAQIQTADVSTLSTTAIAIPDGDALDPATPVIVEVVVN